MNSQARTFRAALLAVAFAFIAPAHAALIGLDLAGMDKSVVPGDSFNEFANGGWMKTTPIPEDKASYGVFTMIADRTRENLIHLIQNSTNSEAPASSPARKIGDFYAAFMDESGIEAKGIAPLQPELERIAGIRDGHDLARVIGGNLRADVDPLNMTSFQTGNLLGVWVSQGLYDPKHHYPYLLQGGLGMPDREYYLSPSVKMAELRRKYQAHIEAMLRLAGQTDPASRAEKIFALEMKIAQVHATRAESAEATNAVVWKRDELIRNAPGLDWPVLLKAASLDRARAFYIWHPRAVIGLAHLVASEPLESWKDWLTFHTLENAAPWLPQAFVDQHFDFTGKALTGTPENRPRWKRGVDFTSAALGGLVGQLYVANYFSSAAKQKVEAMVRDLEKAFDQRIDRLSWMSPATKAKAHEKLHTLRIGVGYPDKWRDHSKLRVEKHDALGNIKRAELFHYHEELAKLKRKPDPKEWWIDSQIVNALNLPLQNALNFPAAILQPPFFDPAADAACNYGALGAIIGHEISHSFDDQGSLFDAQGRLSNWWTPEDLAHFNAAASALVKQYDAYRPFPDIAVHGRQTLSENLADLAGLATACDAFRLSLERAPLRTEGGFTPEQRFFISFGQAWRQKTREAQLRKQIATDGHAPAQYRCSTVRNLDSWYDAFTVPARPIALFAPKRTRARMIMVHNPVDRGERTRPACQCSAPRRALVALERFNPAGETPTGGTRDPRSARLRHDHALRGEPLCRRLQRLIGFREGESVRHHIFERELLPVRP